MKNLYHIYIQRVLIFCALLLSSQLGFAQSIATPTGVTNSQEFCSSLSITLQSTCAVGTPTWLDENDIYITNLSVTITNPVVYQTYCKDGVDSSASVLVTFDALVPIVKTRSRVACVGEQVKLSASCALGTVTWYGNDTTQPALGTGDIIRTISTNETYNVRCEITSPACNSDFETVSFTLPSGVTILDPADIAPDVYVCEGSSISLNATCRIGSSFIFAADGITEVINPITPQTTTSTYKVRCEDGVNCPSTFTNVIIHVVQPATPSTSASSNAYSGEIVALVASCSAAYTTPNWYMDDETTPLASTTVRVIETTIYKVRCESALAPGCNGAFASHTVNITDFISTQPVSTLICLGDVASFTVSVNDQFNAISYQWQKRQSNGTYIDIPAASDTVLTIANTTMSSKGYYRCRVNINMPDTTVYSNDAFLGFPQTIRDNGQFTPTSVTIGDDFGGVVAISDSLAVVSAQLKNLAKGSAYIYKLNSNGKWTEVTELKPSGLSMCDTFGASLAISGDTVYVGAPCYHDEGAVFVFVRQTDGTWPNTSIIENQGAGYGDNFGFSIAVENNTMAIGADDYSSVFLYQKDNTGAWVFEQEITGNDTGIRFGASVGLSGQSLIVGAPYEGLLGAIYIFERDENNTWVKKFESTPSSLSSNSFYGAAVAISGNTALATSYNPVPNPISVYYYERNASGNWQLIDTLKTDTLMYHANEIYSLAIRNNTILIGAPSNNNDKGAVIVFEKNASNRWVIKKVIIPTGLINGDFYGTSVAIGKNGFVVGSPFGMTLSPTGVNIGSAYFYSLNTSPKPSISTVAQVASVCAGQTATFRLTGLPNTDSYTITYKIDIAGALKTRIVSPDTMGRATFTDTLVWANNNKSIFITKVKNNVSNCEQAINVESVLAVKTPTQIITNPSPQTVCLYETALFTAEATGEGLLTYQWQRQAPATSNANAPLNNNFADLTILSLPYRTFADSGATYKVLVTGACGVATSTAAMLRVVPKAVATGSSPGPICPGTFGTINFVGTPNADVNYKVNTPGAITHSIRLDVNGRGFITTSILTQDTDYMIVSASLNGKCLQQLSTIVKVEVKPSGMNPPITLVSPADDVLPNGVQNRLAQSVQALNKIDNTARATHTGNKYVLLSPGFEAKSGSTYLASISAACP